MPLPAMLEEDKEEGKEKVVEKWEEDSGDL